MRLLIAAIFCLGVSFAHAQASRTDVMADNGVETNADGTNNFKKPIGLDLMGGNTKGLTIYPNPTNDFLIISVAGKPNSLRHITMSTLTGKQVYRSSLRDATVMLDASGIPKGIYVIEVVAGANVYRKKWARQ